MTAERDAMDGAVLDALAAGLDAVPAPASLRARLMDSVAGPAKYLPFCADLARHFDVPGPRMKELLFQIDEPGRWTPGIEPIQGFLHFRPGARHRGLHGGFVRMRRGTAFPLHRHRDRELTYVLEGTLIDDRGEHRGPGGIFDMEGGSRHALAVAGDGDALVALLHGGIEMLGA